MWQISLIAMLGPHFGYKGSLIFKILVLFLDALASLDFTLVSK